MADNRNYRTSYQYGAAARNMDVRREMEQPYESPRHRTGTKAMPLRKGNVIGAVILTVVFAFCAKTMVNYVQLTSELTALNKTVAQKQVELKELRSRNDANYSRVLTSVDLEQIESIAKTELGMTYAKDGQIVTYTATGTDYMRKVEQTNE